MGYRTESRKQVARIAILDSLASRFSFCRFALGVVWSAPTTGRKNDMAEIGKFTQPDASPTYFIDFLDFLDKREAIQNLRTETAKRLRLAPGHKVLDMGCGIGGATFHL